MSFTIRQLQIFTSVQYYQKFATIKNLKKFVTTKYYEKYY
jgi:hypothetical protein